MAKAKTEFERPKSGLTNDDTTFKKITDQDFESPMFKRSSQHVIGAKNTGATTEDVRSNYSVYQNFDSLSSQELIISYRLMV